MVQSRTSEISSSKGPQLFFVGLLATLTAGLAGAAGATYVTNPGSLPVLIGVVIVGIITTVIAAWAD